MSENDEEGGSPNLSEVTIAQLGKGILSALKFVDNYLFFYTSVCEGTQIGQNWLIRVIYCLVGMLLPWAIYFVWQGGMVVGETANVPTFPTELIPQTVVGFFGVAVVLLAFAATHRQDKSYCFCLTSLGLRLGGYPVVTILIVRYLTSWGSV